MRGMAVQADSSNPGFAGQLIEWQRRQGRHALPWQRTRDAYRIWLSEIMLQQTQVLTVIPYYERFLARFPTLADLAAAPADDVLAHWAGLGYYARARNLHRCAQRVVAEYGGRFPGDAARIADLPGIGRSTAAAIAAFAFGERAAILDGNVKRVLARAFGIAGFPGSAKVERELWTLAETLLPDGDIEAYTQGLMDLGATVCTRGKPLCHACPVNAECVARREGRTAELPTGRPKKEIPARECEVLLLSRDDAFLLEQRPPSGIWGGLWGLPELVAAESPAAAAARLGFAIDRVARQPALQHVFTHFRLTIVPWTARIVGTLPQVRDAEALRWVASAAIAAAPLPTPVRRLLDEAKLRLEQTAR
jgi:A/G-specific adenine glycosylase